MKECSMCHEVKPLEDFYKHPGFKDGIVTRCKECYREDTQRYVGKRFKRRYDHFNSSSKYKQIFQRRYAAMYSRVNNAKTQEFQRYKVFGMDIMTADEFIAWCEEEENLAIFEVLYNKWLESGKQKKYAPSIDRINPAKSYTIDNIQWLSHSANVKKGNSERTDPAIYLLCAFLARLS